MQQKLFDEPPFDMEPTPTPQRDILKGGMDDLRQIIKSGRVDGPDYVYQFIAQQIINPWESILWVLLECMNNVYKKEFEGMDGDKSHFFKDIEIKYFKFCLFLDYRDGIENFATETQPPLVLSISHTITKSYHVELKIGYGAKWIGKSDAEFETMFNETKTVVANFIRTKAVDFDYLMK